MKMFLQTVAIAAVLASPLVSHAQSNDPVTRAQVVGQLKQLESVGYNPAQSEDGDYPVELQAAEARVAQKYGAQATSYGPATSGSAQSGAGAAVSN